MPHMDLSVPLQTQWNVAEELNGKDAPIKTGQAGS